MKTMQCVRMFRRFNHVLPRAFRTGGNKGQPFENQRLTSKALVQYLDKYIIGQQDAKRALAIAIIDRSRRLRIVDDDLKKAIIPSNILLLGPTGSGKTEVARKLAKKVDAPFVKVVATKYSEVGFVGEDTSSMIEELAEQAFQDEVASLKVEVHAEARSAAMEEVISAILATKLAAKNGIDRNSAKSMIEAGLMDEVVIEMEATVLDYAISREKESASASNASYANDDIADLPLINARTLLSRNSFRSGSSQRVFGSRPVWRSITVSQALKIMTEKTAAILTRSREPELKERAKKSVEERGIVFIDEFDKMISEAGEESSSFNQKRRGVEKELLTLIEGTVVQTKKLGAISTDHVVFICAGAFSCVSPKQIMPELQGRLPIRCELKPLTEEDFLSILKNVEYNLPTVQRELLRVDGVDIEFTECGLREIAKIAVHMNSELVNTGARRLNTVMGIVMEDLKFNVESKTGEMVAIDSEFVKDRMKHLQPSTLEDLRKFVL